MQEAKHIRQPDSETVQETQPKTQPGKLSKLDSSGKIVVDLTISYKELQLFEKLGSGSYGVVYRGLWKDQPVAVKKFKVQTIDDATLQELCNEASIMFSMSSESPYIMPVKKICLEAPHYSLVMELMPKGSLYQLLKSEQPLSWPVRYRIALDVSYGLRDLHALSILHRDLKSLNILLDDRLRAKLTDFGLAKIKQETDKQSSEAKGTAGWMAPELFAHKPKISDKSDIYSLGMVLWELASRRTPFAEAQNAHVVIGWVTSGKKEQVPIDCPKEFRALIESCWELPEQRPTAVQVGRRLEPLLEEKKSEPKSEFFSLGSTPLSPQQTLVMRKELLAGVSRFDYSGLSTVAASRMQQALADEKAQQLARWQLQRQALLLKPELAALFGLQTDLLAGLSGLWRHDKPQILALIAQLWSEVGPTALASASHWQDGLWDGQLLALLHFLKQERQFDLLKKIHEVCRNGLVTKLTSAQQDHDQQQKAILAIKDSQQETLQRIENWTQWQQTLQLWLDELGEPEEDKASTLPATGSSLPLTDPQAWREALQASCDSDRFAPFERYYLTQKKAWQDALRQERDTTGALHHILVVSLRAAQAQLKQQLNTAQRKIATESETLQSQCDATAKTCQKLQATIDSLTKLELTPSATKPLTQLASTGKTVLRPELTTLSTMEKPSLSEIFWHTFADQVRRIEQLLGAAPTAFNVLAWNASAPGIELGEWQWGLLLGNTDAHDYWRAFSQLLTIALKEDLSPLAPLGMRWSTAAGLDSSVQSAPIVTDMTPYCQRARVVAISKSHPTRAHSLWLHYLRAVEAGLKADSGNLPARQWLGQQEMHELQQTLVSSVALPKTGRAHLGNLLLFPLLKMCAALDSYINHYHAQPLPREVKDEKSSAFEQPSLSQYLHPQFMADVSAAIGWCEQRVLLLEQAELAQTPPTGLARGEVLLADIPTQTPKPQHPFYLTSAEQQIYRQHYERALACLTQLQAVCASGQPLKADVDPLQAWYDQAWLHIQAHQVADQRQLEILLKQLIDVSIHRNWLTLAQHQDIYFDKLSDIPQRALYIRLLQTALPTGHPLPAQLRRASNHAGWSLEIYEEQQHWEQQVLPGLWLTESGSPPSSPDKDRERKSTGLQPQISVVRQIMRGGRLQWQVQSHALKPDIAKKLFTPEGDWLAKDPTISGNHRVYRLDLNSEHCVWIKVYPEQPANEFLIHGLDRRLGIYGTPMMELVKFHHGSNTSAALISEAVLGNSLRTVLKDTPDKMAQLNFASFVQTLLRVLLTNPEDDKDDDYFLAPQPDGSLRLVRIDNERAFFEVSRTETGTFISSNVIQVKSIIYCLAHMRNVWPKTAALNTVLTDFLHRQPIAVISDLLTHAKSLHAGWNILFSQAEVEAHFQRPAPEIGLPLMCIPAGLAKELVTRLTLIHSQIKWSLDKHTNLTGIELLKTVQKKLATYYEPIHLEEKSRDRKSVTPLLSTGSHHLVSQHFHQVAGKEYDKGRQGQYVSKVPGSIALQKSLRLRLPIDKPMLAKIRAEQACSPKQELEQFAQWEKSQLSRLYEKLLQAKETLAIGEFQGLPLRCQLLLWQQIQQQLMAKTLTLSQQSFVLQAITGCAWTELDLQHFHPDIITQDALKLLLKAAKEADCHITVLNISGCTALKEDILDVIAKDCPQLKHLSMNGQTKWRQVHIGDFPALATLECNRATALTQLTFGEFPQLASVSLTGAVALKALEKQPKKISVSQALPWALPQLSDLDTRDCSSLQSVQLQLSAPEKLSWLLEGCVALTLPILTKPDEKSPASLLKKLREQPLLTLEGDFEFGGKELSELVDYLLFKKPQFDSPAIQGIWKDLLTESESVSLKRWG